MLTVWIFEGGRGRHRGEGPASKALPDLWFGLDWAKEARSVGRTERDAGSAFQISKFPNFQTENEAVVKIRKLFRTRS